MPRLASLLLAALLPVAAHAQQLSPHADALRLHPYDRRVMELPVRPAVGDAAFKPGRVIFGYLPYWVDAGAPIHYEWLTHLAYFSLDLTAQATLSSTAQDRLAGTRFQSVRDAAKSKGVKLVLTFTQFDKPTIASLVGAQRAAAVQTIVDTVHQAGADGASIDFEGTPATARADFVQFIRDLSTSLKARVPGAHLSVALPIIDWSSVYDANQLAQAADSLIIMGYDCHYKGSAQAGPVAPATKSTYWGRCSEGDGIDTYLGLMGQEARSRLVLGVPFYGYQWATASDALKANTLGPGTSVFWNACAQKFAQDRRWDSDSSTAWTTWLENGQQQQLWCDDAESLDAKLQLILARDIGGLAIWALGYEGTMDDGWAKIRQRLAAPTPPPPKNDPPTADAGSNQYVVAGALVTLDGSRSSDPEGDSLTFQWTQATGAAVDFDATAEKPTFTPPQAGRYSFRLVVSDGVSESSPAVTDVLVDPAPQPKTPDAGTPVDPGSGGDAPKGCGCDAGSTFGVLPLAMALLVRRRR